MYYCASHAVYPQMTTVSSQLITTMSGSYGESRTHTHTQHDLLSHHTSSKGIVGYAPHPSSVSFISCQQICKCMCMCTCIVACVYMAYRLLYMYMYMCIYMVYTCTCIWYMDSTCKLHVLCYGTFSGVCRHVGMYIHVLVNRCEEYM